LGDQQGRLEGDADFDGPMPGQREREQPLGATGAVRTVLRWV